MNAMQSEPTAPAPAKGGGGDAHEANTGTPDRFRMLKPMLFVHIPKTAGTSLRAGVAEFLGAERMALDYGRDQKATSGLVRRWLYEEKKPARFRSAFDRHGFKFFSGHIKLSDYIGWFDLDNVAVFLRDPVQRVVSEYQHFTRHYGYTKSIEDFVDTPAFQNKQARSLAGIDPECIGALGLMERYEESVRRINEKFGWKIPVRRENLGRDETLGPYEVPNKMRKRIERANPLDTELYSQARDVFDKPSQTIRRCTAPAIGSCKLEGGGTVCGWACRIGSERATQVRIAINGKPVATLNADLFRHDLQRKGLKRSGCAGFEFKLPELTDSDEIRCIELDGNQDLNNSPIRYVASD